MKCHQWTGDDDRFLTATVEASGPVFAFYAEQGKSYNEGNAWDSIAGRLAPGILVTGAAARRRWQVLQERIERSKRAAEAGAKQSREVEAWERAQLMVAKYERDLDESNHDRLGQVEAHLGRIAHIVDRIARELGIEETWE